MTSLRHGFDLLNRKERCLPLSKRQKHREKKTIFIWLNSKVKFKKILKILFSIQV